jgi:hypothetical protein
MENAPLSFLDEVGGIPQVLAIFANIGHGLLRRKRLTKADY